MPMRAADGVGGDRAHDLAAEQVRRGPARRPRCRTRRRPRHRVRRAPRRTPGPARATRRSGSSRGRRPAWRRAARPGGRAARAVRRARCRVGRPVEGLPGGRVGEPVVGAAVDDQHVLAELRREGPDWPCGSARNTTSWLARVSGWSRPGRARPGIAGGAGARPARCPRWSPPSARRSRTLDVPPGCAAARRPRTRCAGDRRPDSHLPMPSRRQQARVCRTVDAYSTPGPRFPTC